MDNFVGLRTYLAGFGVIIHQVGKFFGYDFSNELISETTDIILGLAMIIFRWRASVIEQIKVRQALYTPVPNPPHGDIPVANQPTDVGGIGGANVQHP